MRTGEVWVVWSQPIVGINYGAARLVGVYSLAGAAQRVARDLPYGQVTKMRVEGSRA